MTDKFSIPTVIVVYGATGDLMARKITPALFNLWEKGKLPKMFKIIGVSRRDMTDKDFRAHILSHASKFVAPSKKSKIKKFCSLFFFQQGQFENKTDYEKLAQVMGRIDDTWHVCSNKLFYLAVPPEYYHNILSYLHDSGLTEPCSPEEGWTRVLVEKPFGKDLKTAKDLDKLLSALFKEEQIYRIDHYLGKEMLQNILAFRFSNNILEESWNNRFIERIDITVHEDKGVEKRGDFYDPLGALRDVGQNHLLQMLALVTMDNPVSLTASAIRTKRAEVLSRLAIPTEEMIKDETLRAQYDGYKSIKGVKKNSRTETYFKVRARLNSSRWEGVPIYLSSGKRFSKPHKEIVVTFRNPEHCLTCLPGQDYQNKVVFTLEPEERIVIQFFSKKPGLELVTQQKDLSFVYRSARERTQYVEEYEKLLLDCILGDQTLFVSTDEVIPMWAYTDAIVSGWRQNLTPLKNYKPGTDTIAEQKLKIQEQKDPNRMLSKRIGVVGLGKMGKGIALQLMDRGWQVHGYNRTETVTKDLIRQGLNGLYNQKDFVKVLSKPRVVWIMVPAGKAVDDVLFGKDGLVKHLKKGDIIIDAGNSHYKNTIKRAKKIKKAGLRFVDVGVSGGPSGARFGACCMIGGDRQTFEYLEPLFADISVPRGYQFFEGVGAGHFVKMVHNGIEYGMMQAIGEGFEVLKKTPFELDLTKVADVYNHGSVIQSRLVQWLQDAYEEFGTDLDAISGSVKHSGEGQWTVEAGKDLKVKTEIIKNSLQFRLDSDKNPSYTGQVVSALRGQFGGHSVEK